MVTVFLGPPGVGKGTQAKRLADDQKWAHVSTGDLLRAARREGTPLGLKAQEYMDAGDLVPDDLILGLVREHLEEMGHRVSVIFDGFPRTGPQAESLGGILEELDRQVDLVILFEAEDDVLVQRIAGRRSCPCGKVYNVYFTPPTIEGRCDDCDGELVHRADDEPETVRRRLEVYRELTEPLIDFYRENGPAPVAIEAMGSPDEVWEQVVETFSAHARGSEE